MFVVRGDHVLKHLLTFQSVSEIISPCFLRSSVQFVRRAGVREVGGYVLMEAGPLDQLHFYWGLLTDLAHPSSPFFCHDCNHTALFKGNLSKGVTYPFVCACVTA